MRLSSFKTRIWRCSELLLPAIASLTLLSACVASSPYESEDTFTDSSATDSSIPDAAATYPAQPSSAATADTSSFNFPMATCGEHTNEPNETWYSVFIDNGNVNEIRNRYCGDAISVTREKSGIPTVQVASFASYAKALSLAKAIGGVVEQTAAQAASSSTSAAQPYPTSSPANPNSASTADLQAGQAVYLSANESSIPINIRSGASTSAEVQATGLVGDRVQIAESVQGNDGATWYKVRLGTGDAGWVRGDLISTQAPPVNRAAQSSAHSQAPQPPVAQPPAASSPYLASEAPSYQPADPPSPYTRQPSAQPPYPQSSYNQQPYNQPPYNQPYNQQPYPANQPGYSQPSSDQPSYRQPYGQPAYGENRGSALTARDPGTSINIREYASINSRVRYRANPGDPIQILGTARGDDGFPWKQVQFSSGAIGWVRGDFVAN